MTGQDIFHKDTEYIAHTYQRFPVAVRCGHGATAEDFEGNSYIDFGSGIGTNSLGFCNEGWVAAVTEQLRLVQLASNEVHVADIRTCVLHPASETHRQLTEEQLEVAGIDSGMVRLSVGLEHVEDIIEDLERAFSGLKI